MVNQPIDVDVGVVAYKAQKLIRERRSDIYWYCQVLVLLLAKPAAVVIHVQSQPRLPRVVGAATVKQPAAPDQDRPGLHVGSHDRRIVVQLRRILAVGDQARCAVLGGELGQGPHGVYDQRRVWASDREHYVVLVEELRALTGMDLDRVDNRNLGRAERVAQKVQDRRMGDQGIDGTRLGQHVVHPPRAIAEKLSLAEGLL